MVLPVTTNGDQTHSMETRLTEAENAALKELFDRTMPIHTSSTALRGLIEDMVDQSFLVKKSIVERYLLKCSHHVSGIPTGTLIVIDQQDPRTQQLDQISAVSTLSMFGSGSKTKMNTQRFHQILYRPRKFIRAIDRVPGSVTTILFVSSMKLTTCLQIHM